jgi:shingomyelin synthase
LFIAALTFKEYAPKRLAPIAHFLHLCAFVGVVCILLARKHYTIDVVLGYALTTYNFATYHTLAMLANGGDLVDRLPITKVGLWSSAVRYFEWDSPPTIVNRLQWPSSCPQLIRKRCA